MNSKVFWAIKILLVASMYLVGYLLLPKLPELVPIHWNAAGVVDNTWPKERAILLLPTISLLMMVLFPVFAAIDPRKERYKQFAKAWEIFQLIFILFFSYLYFLTIYLSFYPEILILPYLLPAFGVLYIVIGNYLGKIRQNYFVGIKTPWTLDNEEVWNKTHRLGAWLFAAAGLVNLINAYFLWHPFPLMLISIGIAALVPVFWSYVLHRRTKRQTT